LAELFLRHLAQQAALQVTCAVQVDVAAQPLPSGDVGVLIAGRHPELRALSWRRRLVVEGSGAIRVVERTQIRDRSRIGGAPSAPAFSG
jgi:hypothetical protein